MKLDFDISTIDYKIIHEILIGSLNSDYTIWVFGSRVKNQTKYNSDLDLAVEYKNKIDIKLLRKIKRELEESKLPFKVDILDLNATSKEFNALIKKDMIPFPLKFLNKVPKLRFKEFSGEWKEKRADYLLDRYSNPVEVKASEEYRQIGTRSHGKALVINIVFAWEHSIALTSEREKCFIASHRFPMYLPKENRCNLNFLLEFFLRKYGKYLLGLASPGGAGRNKTLGQSNFNELKLIVPSIEEQERIVGFLSLVDQKIEKVTEQLSLLEEYKKGVMQKIFSQEIRFKDDDGGEFEDWVEKKLGDIGIITTGKTPNTHNPIYWNGDIHFITPTDITDDHKYQTKTSRTVTEQDKMKILPKGSILYTCIASIGKIAITTQLSITNQQINAVSVNDNYDNEFIYYTLLELTPYIKSFQSNNILPIINKTEFSKFTINLPSKKEQIKIANFLIKIDQRIEASRKQLEESKEYKKALLQQMFI